MIYASKEIEEGFTAKGDVCIVGSGVGGCILARKFAEKGLKVVLLDAGPYIPTERYNRNAFETMRRVYMNGGALLALGNPPVGIMAGNLVGGTMEIYSGTCLRAPRSVFERWKNEFGSEVDITEVNHKYDEMERWLEVTPVKASVAGKGNLLVKTGAEKLGWKGGFIPRSAPECIGCGNCNLGCFVGAKRTVLNTFLQEGELNGVEIYPLSLAVKIERKGDKVTAVEGWTMDDLKVKRGKFRVEAKFFVISAGALMTPVILLYNGINPNGRVGKNLHIHPAVGCVGVFREEIQMWNSVIQGYKVDEFEGEGIRIEGGFPVVEAFMAAAPFSPSQLNEIVDIYKHAVVFGAMVEDETKGKVSPASDLSPRIFYNPSEEDIKKYIFGMVKVAELLFAAGAERVIVTVESLPSFSNLKELESYLSSVSRSDFMVSAYHPMGTVSFGDNKHLCAIDNNFRVYGLKNLFVCDGSIVPSSLGVNPVLTIGALTLIASDRILRSV